MKIGRYIFPVLLVLYLPAAADESGAPPEEPPTYRTLKLHAEYVYTYLLPDCYSDTHSMFINLQHTWGESFYGGPAFCVILDWSHEGWESLTTPAVELGLGGVIGFNFEKTDTMSAHVELAIYGRYNLKEHNPMGLLRLNFGPAFDLGNGWRLSAEMDCFIFAIGGGLGLSYSF